MFALNLPVLLNLKILGRWREYQHFCLVHLQVSDGAETPHLLENQGVVCAMADLRQGLLAPSGLTFHTGQRISSVFWWRCRSSTRPPLEWIQMTGNVLVLSAAS